MSISLVHSLNKIISVSIPSLFGDGMPHVCTLVGIETGGVWLQITDPGFRLFPAGENRARAANPNVFVPFAQIAYLLDSTTITNPKDRPAEQASKSSNPNPTIKTRAKRKK